MIFFFNRRPCIRYKKNVNPTIRADGETFIYGIKSTLSHVSLLNIIEEIVVDETLGGTHGARENGRLLWVSGIKLRSMIGRTNFIYPSTLVPHIHGHSRRPEFNSFFLNRGSLMWALWWSVEYGW